MRKKYHLSNSCSYMFYFELILVSYCGVRSKISYSGAVDKSQLARFIWKPPELTTKAKSIVLLEVQSSVLLPIYSICTFRNQADQQYIRSLFYIQKYICIVHCFYHTVFKKLSQRVQVKLDRMTNCIPILDICYGIRVLAFMLFHIDVMNDPPPHHFFAWYWLLSHPYLGTEVPAGRFHVCTLYTIRICNSIIMNMALNVGALSFAVVRRIHLCLLLMCILHGTHNSSLNPVYILCLQ